MRVNFACVWVGEKYGPEYVAILRDMVLRNASTMEHECAFWAVTDRPEELPEGVEAIAASPDLPGWWQKVFLFSPDMPWAEGDRCVYFDLDVVVTGRLEDLVETKGIIRDWHWPCFNSSVMVWDHGEHREVWEQFDPAQIDRPGPIIGPELLPKGQVNGGDQEWVTLVDRTARSAPWPIFPRSWFVSYRHAGDWPPEGCKAVIFHGRPKPHEVARQDPDGWVANTWKVGGWTSLPAMRGINVSLEHIWANVRANVQRDLPWFTGDAPHGREAVLVCGGPSMRRYVEKIRAHKRRGARLVTVNNAWRFLLQRGIRPDAHVMLDAREENAEFVKDAPREGVTYFVASQCHPAVFDALEGRDVAVWHNGVGDCAELHEILEPWWGEGPDQRPIVLVPGGCTVGLRALWLLTFSGYRTIHVYGMDSSFEEGKHHAYAQAINDADAVMRVRMGGKEYLAARWMVRQAREFPDHWRDLQRQGVTLHVHGSGLIPDMARDLRAADRSAA